MFNFISPMSGTMLVLSDVPDEAFSTKALGDGFAIDIRFNSENMMQTTKKVVAPFDGTVEVIMPHAVALSDKNGIEVLIHIGIDTVKLNGEGFKTFVEEGQAIKAGDLLIEVNVDLVSKTKSVISPIIFTGGNKIKMIKMPKTTIAHAEQNIIELLE